MRSTTSGSTESRHHVSWLLSAAGMVLLFGGLHSVARAGLITTIDDFSSATLSSEWAAPTNVLANGSPAVPNFSVTSNPGKLTFTHTNTTTTAAQFAMMRDDFSLVNDGDYVQLAVTIESPTVGSATAILTGLVLDHVTDSPASRANNYTMYMVGNGRIDVVKGGTIIGQTATGVFTIGSEVLLRFTRTDATHVASSYSVDGGVMFTPVPGITVAESVIGGYKAAGVYVGNAVSGTAGTTITFDDLVYFDSAIPEPSCAFLATIGALMFLHGHRPMRKPMKRSPHGS